MVNLRRTALAVLIVVAAFYAYGAVVHVANMAGTTGIDWPDAPLKWQVLDVVYLVLDLLVMVFLPVRKQAGIVAFYLAAVSQIVLYTLGRDWIMDVPEAFQRPDEDLAYLDTLVAFHVATLMLVSAALWQFRRA